MNEEFQLYPDPRTGFLTAIRGDDASGGVRSACTALNRRRARGLIEAARPVTPGQPLAADVWAINFAEQSREWELPIVDLKRLGLLEDRDGFLTSAEFRPLPSGAEAQPFLDERQRVVYKLFDLRDSGGLGKKLVLAVKGNEVDIEITDANIFDTIEKLRLLNDGGGLPTEIIGLSSSYKYFVVKQPLAVPFRDFETDRELAEEKMCGVIPIGGGLRQRSIVSFINDRAWLVGDLHDRNIMRDSSQSPVIIDALHGKIPPGALTRLPWLASACRDAEIFRRTGLRPKCNFGDVDDGEL